MAVGLTKSTSVDKGPFVNAMMVLGDERFNGAAYIACNGDGEPVSLTLRFSLADMSGEQIAALHKNAPIRGDQRWRWSDGSTQPVGRKGSRWTVGGPRNGSTASIKRAASGDVDGEQQQAGDIMADVLRVMPVSPRGRLNKAQQGVCDAHSINATTLRGLAVSIS